MTTDEHIKVLEDDIKWMQNKIRNLKFWKETEKSKDVIGLRKQIRAHESGITALKEQHDNRNSKKRNQLTNQLH